MSKNMSKRFGKNINGGRTKATGKKLHFEDSLYESLHHRDYGFIEIKEAKTPYPRFQDPVSAKMLHERLLDALARFNQESIDSDSKFSTEKEKSLKELNVKDDKEDYESINNEGRQERHREFARKRKEFDHGEFTLAKQKRLSASQEAGPSISNWRIVDDMLIESEEHRNTLMHESSDCLLH